MSKVYEPKGHGDASDVNLVECDSGVTLLVTAGGIQHQFEMGGAAFEMMARRVSALARKLRTAHNPVNPTAS